MSDQTAVEDTSPRKQRRDAQENRQQIIAAAKEMFATQGVDQTSMYEIARAAGVGQGTLYRHFADKGELCRGLIKEDIHAFQERVGALIGAGESALSALERLDLLISEKLRLTESHLPLFAAMDDAATGQRRTRLFRGPFYTWQHEQIVRLLGEAVSAGEIAPLDAPFTADVILAATAPPLYSFQRQELEYSSERIVAAMRRLFATGARR